MLCFLAAALCVAFSGCHESASTSTKQAQQDELRQADRGEALLKAAAAQLSDLPAAVDTELRPPVVLLDSRKSADGKDVLATCTANPKAAADMFNVIKVPAGNSRFRSLGVQSGDILKYYVKEDETVDADSRNAGFSRQLAMDLNVAQVIDDNTLLIESGLNQPVTPASQNRNLAICRRPPSGNPPKTECLRGLSQPADRLGAGARRSSPLASHGLAQPMDPPERPENRLATRPADRYARRQLRGDAELAKRISPEALRRRRAIPARRRPTHPGSHLAPRHLSLGTRRWLRRRCPRHRDSSIGPCGTFSWKPMTMRCRAAHGKHCCSAEAPPNNELGYSRGCAGSRGLMS